MKRTVWVSDELWGRVKAAAAAEGERRGAPMSVAEWVRGALGYRLQLEAEVERMRETAAGDRYGWGIRTWHGEP